MDATLKTRGFESALPFWLLWVAANSIGWAVGLMAENSAQLALEAATGGALKEADGGMLMEALGLLVFGLAAGVAQWWALRSRLAGAIWWILATAGGFTLAGVVGGALQDTGSPAGGWVVSFGIGLAAGVLQWLILRGQFRHSGWWAPASSVLVFTGLLTGLFISAALTGAGPSVSASGAAFAAAGGAVYGMVSGLGVAVDPFLMAITIGASCAFLTPIGHQSNTLVMGPGGLPFW
jgi:di/tricarboxylate transporter